MLEVRLVRLSLPTRRRRLMASSIIALICDEYKRPYGESRPAGDRLRCI
jgi:hypothetical protein